MNVPQTRPVEVLATAMHRPTKNAKHFESGSELEPYQFADESDIKPQPPKKQAV